MLSHICLSISLWHIQLQKHVFILLTWKVHIFVKTLPFIYAYIQLQLQYVTRTGNINVYYPVHENEYFTVSMFEF